MTTYKTDSHKVTSDKSDYLPMRREEIVFARKRRHCLFSYKCVVFLLSGILFLSILGGILLTVTNFGSNIVLQNLVLRNGTQAFDWWVEPPVTPVMKVYIFNYTNTEEFVNGSAKLRVQQLGPYTYRRKLEKVNVHFNDNNTVSFQQRTTFYFDPELSSGSLDDRIVVPNIPLLGAVSIMRDSYYILKKSLSFMLTSMSMQPFVHVTAEEYLWGYDEPLVAAAKVILPPKYTQPGRKFGILVGRNSTSPNNITVFTGEGDLGKLDVIDRYDGMDELEFWASDECNRIDGSEGTIFPPSVTTHTKLHIYNREMCRRFPLVYKEDVSVQGIPGYRFQAPDDMLASEDRNPENSCYCLDKTSCLPSGLFNASPCAFGAPVVVSFPHYYLGDPSLLETIDGLHPKKEDHEFYLDVQYKFGIPLAVKSRLQLNVVARKVDGISHVRAFKNDTILPVVWFEETVDKIPPDVLDVLHYALFTLKFTSEGFVYFLLSLALLSFFLLIYIFVRRRRNKQRI